MRKKLLGIRWRIVGLLLLAALLPLGLLSIGAWTIFSQLLEARSRELQHTLVSSHAVTINIYLSKLTHALQLFLSSYSKEQLEQPELLGQILARLNATYDTAFTDLGLLNEEGQNISYAGPYPLQGRLYGATSGFRHVQEHGHFISDVFLGLRGLPHQVIAVRHQDAQQRTFYLRATLNSARFERLVQAGRPGQTGTVFIVNEKGQLQTPSRHGKVLDRWQGELPIRHEGVRESKVVVQGVARAQTTTWINDRRWMLIVRQDEAEIYAPIQRAVTLGLVVIGGAVLLIALTTLLATLHLSNQIDLTSAQRDKLSQEFLRSAKLASLGEMASGLAHEINNPLAILSAEHTNVSDLVCYLAPDSPERQEVQESLARCSHQIERCASITGKMLQFARHAESKLQPTELKPCLEEIVRLVDRSTRSRQVTLQLVLADDLPPVLLDPTELEQVLMNLINNSLHASRPGSAITIGARQENGQMLLTVRDTGCGISADDLEHIFQPFFTTKPVGEGTGLGLPVCYGIVQNWGGKIGAESYPGEGTLIAISLPLAPEAAANAGTADGCSPSGGALERRS